MYVMAECNKSRSAIRGQSGFRCNGLWHKAFQFTMKCAGIVQYSSKNYWWQLYSFYLWWLHVVYSKCRHCFKEYQDGVNKNKQTLLEYKNENEIKTLLEAIEMRKI